jgi:hypothetical protein
MVNQTDALLRLNKEKDYEDKLVEDLSFYFIDYIDDISDLNETEKNKIKEFLNIIISESRKHSYMFNELVEMVLENGENNY